MSQDPNRPELSALESEIVRTIRNVGWYTQLWFPIVQRELLGFDCDVADEQVHSAVVNLIHKNVLVSPKLYEWAPASPSPDTEVPDPARGASDRSGPAVEVATWLSNLWVDQLWADNVHSASTGERGPIRLYSETVDVSYLESHIILSVEHLGWYPGLWFPIVHREYLNFGSHAPDSEFHLAFPSLIRKGALIPAHESPGDEPDWLPGPSALKAAVYKAWGRKI